MLWCSFLLGVTAARLRLVVFQLFSTDLSCLIYSELSADCCALQRVPRVFPCEPISIYTLLFVDIAKISWTAFCWVFVSVSSLRVFTGSSATSCHTINTTPFTKHCDMTQTSPTKSQVTRGATLFKSMTSWSHHVFTRWCNVSLLFSLQMTASGLLFAARLTWWCWRRSGQNFKRTTNILTSSAELITRHLLLFESRGLDQTMQVS